MKLRIISLLGIIIGGCSFIAIKPAAEPITALQPTIIARIDRRALVGQVTDLNTAVLRFEGSYRALTSAIAQFSQHIPPVITHELIVDMLALKARKIAIDNFLFQIHNALRVNAEESVEELGADISKQLVELHEIEESLRQVHVRFRKQLAIYSPEMFAK